jgi:hypothetical protein
VFDESSHKDLLKEAAYVEFIRVECGVSKVYVEGE